MLHRKGTDHGTIDKDGLCHTGLHHFPAPNPVGIPGQPHFFPTFQCLHKGADTFIYGVDFIKGTAVYRIAVDAIHLFRRLIHKQNPGFAIAKIDGIPHFV